MDKIKIDSRDVVFGDTFIALKGSKTDGHNHIKEAINAGAIKIVCEHGDYDIETLIVPDTNIYLKNYLKDNFSHLFDELKIIGVTGTNGKTTTAYLISNILTNLGISNAYIGTIGFYINSKLVKHLNNTTPDILSLYKLLKEIKEKNIKYVVMEVSSHSLELDRLYGIKLASAIFTNLTEDHLDYHKNMDNYLNAKLKIIDHLDKDGSLIVNSDDPYSKYFNHNSRISVGFNKSTFEIINFNYLNDQTEIIFKHKNKEYKVKVNFKAKYNIYNYMEALASLNSLGIRINDIIDISNKISTPIGRMEIIKFNNNYIIIDYAHTPDAVLKIIKEVNECYHKNIITIIGCGGNREKEKRPIMGEIASKYSNHVIFTNDNPRDEDEISILNDITINLRKNNFEIIKDRKEAILKGIKLLDNNVLLILGKGHEEYQIIKGIKYPFSDREIVLDYIKNN